MASFSESIKGEQLCSFFIHWDELLQMCAPEFPMSSPQLNGPVNVIEKSNTVNGRKRRRKRTNPILSEEDMNALKRKPTAPVKPPVSKKSILCADFSQRPNKWVEMPEGFELPKEFEVKEEVIDERQETKEAVNLLLKELDAMEEEHRKSPTKSMEEKEEHTCPIHCKPVKKHVSKNGWEYYKCSESPCMLFCAAQDVEEYLLRVNVQLPAWFRNKNDLPVCFCRKVVTLKVSRSEKNPGKVYMSCSQRDKCGYFQWGSDVLFGKNKEWKDQLFFERNGVEARSLSEWLNHEPQKRWEEMERPLIQLQGGGNIIASPEELRGLIYTPELEKTYRMLLSVRQAEENLKKSNVDHQTAWNELI